MTRPVVAGSSVALPAAALPLRSAPRLLRAARIIHPFPTLLNVAATAGLAFVAVRGVPGASIMVRMLGVMLCAQCAIGVANDYFDRDLDAVTKPWKPVAAGLVSPGWAMLLTLGLGVTAAGVAATLGPGSFALAMLGMASGLAYDARLKRSLLSAVPYMVAIPTLPFWVWLTLGAWTPVLWWLLPLGSLIGLALHLANTLPDLEGDAANGVTGLAHRLGARTSMLLAYASFAAALALSAVLATVVDYDARYYLPALVVGIAALAGSGAAFAVRRNESTLQLGFGALSLASAALAVGWLAAVT